ncbi:phenylalanine--tRNA ligase subunit alpha [archaeon]|jgi:phenylalanyl-tRNA synthetase alpha chain|nr:phenylalanine--tRNA ligase subunit alpha [archaeon]
MPEKQKDKPDMQKLVESLSPNERRIVGFLEVGDLDKLRDESGLDKTSLLRALEFLSNKGILTLRSKEEKVVVLSINGLNYKRDGLPERRLGGVVVEKNSLSLMDAKKESGLSDNEFKVALGALKKRALINIVNGNIVLVGGKDVFVEKTLDEKFLELLPKKFSELEPEEKFSFDNLKSRKNIVEIENKKIVEFDLTDLGKELVKVDLTSLKNMIESVTPGLIKSGSWKGKKFRRYDITSDVPKISGGKRHFVNQATDYAKRVWLDMGFKEMSGSLIQSGFWNFDALFTAQDHPVREMQDTFFINGEAELPASGVVEKVKKAHEGGIDGSKGWQSSWSEDDAKKVLLRTHTTCLSVQTLKKIAEKKEFPAKYFALGKCFRNETVDWSHGFEFNQTEGIVVDENANFRQLLGYLKEFFKKMGYEEIRIRPAYFPYTEPSLEIDVFHPVRKEWVELGGAGMFRPEVTIPMFGRHIPVLAWGPGFDRIIMEFFKVEDLRDMYKNDLNALREKKVWRK